MAAKIIVLGGSFGGLTVAFELKRHLGDKADVTVISDLDRFIFIPSLPWVSMGWRRPDDITLPLQRILKPKGIEFIHQEAETVDAETSEVVTPEGRFGYDYLVIATGPALVFSAVPGLGPEGGYTECIFTLDQAVRCHEKWVEFLKDPGPIVTGSVQGVSCFGPPYEYAFEVDAELRKRKLRHKAPITFITSEPYVGHFGIGGLGKSRRIMEDEFAEREINVIANTAVDEFKENEVVLKDGTKIPFKLSMFAPPMSGVKAVSHLGNPKGFIPVDENYRHKEITNIYSVGVAVAMAPPEQTPVPTGLPKTGYMTVKMAKDASATLSAEILGKEPPQTEPVDVVCLMDMGNTAALMKATPVIPPRQESVLKEGIYFKWLKAGFEKYYLWKISRGLTQLP